MQIYISSYSSDCTCFKCQYDITLEMLDIIRFDDLVEEYQKDKKGALLIITHSTRILESLHVDKTHVLVNGKIVASGDASLVDEINEHGFERFLEA